MVWGWGVPGRCPTSLTTLGKHFPRGPEAPSAPQARSQGDRLLPLPLVFLPVAGDLPRGAGGGGPGPRVLPEGEWEVFLLRCPQRPREATRGGGRRVLGKLRHRRSGGPVSQAPTLPGTSGPCFLSGSQEPSPPSVDADVFNMGARRGRFPGGGWFLSPPKEKSDIRGEREAWPRATCQTMKTAPASPACEDKEEGAGQVRPHRVPSESGFKVTTRLISGW